MRNCCARSAYDFLFKGGQAPCRRRATPTPIPCSCLRFFYLARGRQTLRRDDADLGGPGYPVLLSPSPVSPLPAMLNAYGVMRGRHHPYPKLCHLADLNYLPGFPMAVSRPGGSAFLRGKAVKDPGHQSIKDRCPLSLVYRPPEMLVEFPVIRSKYHGLRAVLESPRPDSTGVHPPLKT